MVCPRPLHQLVTDGMITQRLKEEHLIIFHQTLDWIQALPCNEHVLDSNRGAVIMWRNRTEKAFSWIRKNKKHRKMITDITAFLLTCVFFRTVYS